MVIYSGSTISAKSRKIYRSIANLLLDPNDKNLQFFNIAKYHFHHNAISR